MPNVLMELYATLGLDTTDFKQEAEAAIEQSDKIGKEVEGAFKQADSEYSKAKQDLTDLDTKSESTRAFMNGIVGAVSQLTEEAIEALIDYAGESVEVFLSKGGSIAEAYEAALNSIDLTNEALKMRVGSVLVPLKTGFIELAESMSGIDRADKLMVMLDRMESYSSESFDALSASLDSVFGRFATAEFAEEKSIADMTAGIQSQVDYWNEYADTLDALKKRGIDPAFLSDIADGTAESLATLQSIEEADSTQLEQLTAAFEAVEEAKARTAEGLHETQLLVDKDFLAMAETVEELVKGMNQAEAAKAATEAIGSAAAEGLANTAPSISAWVDYINRELSSIGAGYQAPTFGINEAINQGFATNEMGFSYWHPHASGISYVPYNGYPAILHEGESVLTRKQAEADRAGGGVYTPAILAKLDAVADAIASMSVNMDGNRVGDIVTNRVSRNIAREARTGRRT